MGVDNVSTVLNVSNICQADCLMLAHIMEEKFQTMMVYAMLQLKEEGLKDFLIEYANSKMKN